MNEKYEKLVRDYLAGATGEAEVRELSERVVQEPAARRELLLSAALETDLVRLMSSEQTLPLPSARSRGTTILCYAALVAVALGGWGLAWKMSSQVRQNDQRIATLTDLLTFAEAAKPVVEQPVASQPVAVVQESKALEIIDTRGLVLLCGANEQDLPISEGVGSIIPAGRDVWTCPWGGVGTRDADGTLISLDRNTVASFAESGKAREVWLREGIVSVMRPVAKQYQRPALITTREATVTLNGGQVTVVAETNRTLVETAGGQVTVRRRSDGRTVTVSQGHYAIVGASGEVSELAGRLQWDPAPLTVAGR